MNNEEINNKVLEWIATYKDLNSKDSLQKKSFDELNVNSIEFIGLVVKCENEFGVTFEDEKLLLDAFPNLESFVTYITNQYSSLE